jgi:hypothetical protein
VVARNHRGESNEPLVYGATAALEVEYEVVGPVVDPVLGITFENANGQTLGGLTSRFAGLKLDVSQPRGTVRLVLDPVIFTRGLYKLSVSLQDERLQRFYDVWSRSTTFSVEGPSLASREVSGHVIYPHRWHQEAR